jgi:hypothetical protein
MRHVDMGKRYVCMLCLERAFGPMVNAAVFAGLSSWGKGFLKLGYVGRSERTEVTSHVLMISQDHLMIT